MNRNNQYSALVLRVRPCGESNREVYFLTAEEGIIRATLYGGPKSKLRSHVAPYHFGTLWVYRDPAKDSRKVSDFDVKTWRPGLRELYERIAAAAVIAETIISGHGSGGSWETALSLADQSLDALETADSKGCSCILLKFLWHWFDLLGIRPDFTHCVSCGNELAIPNTNIHPSVHHSPSDYNSPNACHSPSVYHSQGACPPPDDGVLWYSGYDGGFVCQACKPDTGRSNFAKRENVSLRINVGVKRWLKNVETVTFRESIRYTLDEVSMRQITALMGALLSSGTIPTAWKEWSRT